MLTLAGMCEFLFVLHRACGQMGSKSRDGSLLGSSSGFFLSL